MKTKLAGIFLVVLFSVLVFAPLSHTADLRLAEPVDHNSLINQWFNIPEDIIQKIQLIPDQSDDCVYAKKVGLKFLKAENGMVIFQGTIVGQIEQPGDVDWFEFDNGWTWGIIHVSTIGNTDTSGELYPACQSTATFNDDNSGDGDNFSIYAGMAGAGTWKIKVSHSTYGTGTYTLIITIAVPFS
jgi:hypothetical protein